MANVSRLGNVLVFVPADDCLLDLEAHPAEASLRPGGNPEGQEHERRMPPVLPSPGMRHTARTYYMEEK